MTGLVPAVVAILFIVAACSTGAASPGATGTPAPSTRPSTAATATPAGSPSPSEDPSATASPSPAPTTLSTPTASPSLAPTSPPTPDPTAASNPRVLVDLPVVPCDVTDGSLEGPAPTPEMTVATIEAPASIVARAVWHGIGTDQLVLGPAGWVCSAAIGADGSERITLASRADPDARLVYELYPGAPYVSVLELACPLFEAAATELAELFGTPCPRQGSAREIVTRPSEQVARFTDPAGTRGVGTGSGGRYPVHGGLVFHDAGEGLKVAYQVSCAMPGDDEAFCRYLVFDWIERLGFTAGPP